MSNARLLLDIEAMSRPGMVGRAHLDAFSDVVTDFAMASPSATLPSLLDYLYAAEHAEDGLEPGEVEVSEDRVQILTVHSAKGLEWRIVALPHLVKDVFPGRKKSSCWLKSVTELPADLRGDAQDLPVLRLSAGFNRKEVDEALAIHAEEFEDRRPRRGTPPLLRRRDAGRAQPADVGALVGRGGREAQGPVGVPAGDARGPATGQPARRHQRGPANPTPTRRTRSPRT